MKKILIIGLILALCMLSMPVVAEELSAKITMAKTEYAPIETISLDGSGFLPSTEVTLHVTITDSDTILPDWSVETDEFGAFTTYYFPDGVTGSVIITATDGSNTASSVFTVIASTDPMPTTLLTDKTDYSPEETVTIYGYGFLPDVPVNLNVVRPDGSVNPPLGL